MLRKLILTILLITFVSIGSLGAVFFHVQKNVLNKNFIQSTLREQNIYDSVVDEIANQFEKQRIDMLDNQDNSSQTISALLEDVSLSDITNNVLKSAWLQEQTVTNIDTLYTWFDIDEPTVTLSINIQEIKSNIFEEVRNVLNTKQQSTPVCTQSQLLSMALGSQTDITCLPQGMNLDEIFLGTGGIEYFQTVLDAIPNEITIESLLNGQMLPTKAFQDARLKVELDKKREYIIPVDDQKTSMSAPQSSDRSKVYEDFMRNLRGVRQAFIWIQFGYTVWLIIEICLLSLMVLLSLRGFGSLLSWVGASVFLFGVEFGMTYLSIRYWQPVFRQQIEKNFTLQSNNPFEDVISRIIDSLIHHITNPLFLWALLGLGVGSIVLVIGQIWQKKYQSK